MRPRKIIVKKQYKKNRQHKIMLRLTVKKSHNKRKIKKSYNIEFESGKHILDFLSHSAFMPKYIYQKIYDFSSDIVHANRAKHPKLVIPKVFSFIKNPVETIQTLQKLTAFGLNRHTKKIIIDHRQCKTLDICASTVMDTLILSIKEKHRKHNFQLQGFLSNPKDVTEILAASGILKHLHIFNINIPGVECLELLHNENSSEMTQKILEYLSRCLNTQGFELKRKGFNDMGEMISEVIDNCKQHSGLNEWFALGHYSKEDNQKGKVRLVIFNFGRTIYESFSAKESQKNMFVHLTKKAKKIRDDYKDTPSIKSLITLYALQDGISRFNGNEFKSDRGSGTIKLIGTFQAIGKDSNDFIPFMSITSGNTHIIFNEKYKLQPMKINDIEKKIIAFNRENDIDKPPDTDNVKDLTVYFPGTVISMEFFIDRRYLEKMLSKGVKKNAG